MRTLQMTPETITTIGIDLGKNTFHLVGLDKRGAIRNRLTMRFVELQDALHYRER
jgi:transposase